MGSIFTYPKCSKGHILKKGANVKNKKHKSTFFGDVEYTKASCNCCYTSFEATDAYSCQQCEYVLCRRCYIKKSKNSTCNCYSTSAVESTTTKRAEDDDVRVGFQDIISCVADNRPEGANDQHTEDIIDANKLTSELELVRVRVIYDIDVENKLILCRIVSKVSREIYSISHRWSPRIYGFEYTAKTYDESDIECKNQIETPFKCCLSLTEVTNLKSLLSTYHNIWMDYVSITQHPHNPDVNCRQPECIQCAQSILDKKVNIPYMGILYLKSTTIILGQEFSNTMPDRESDYLNRAWCYQERSFGSVAFPWSNMDDVDYDYLEEFVIGSIYSIKCSRGSLHSLWQIFSELQVEADRVSKLSEKVIEKGDPDFMILLNDPTIFVREGIAFELGTQYPTAKNLIHGIPNAHKKGNRNLLKHLLKIREAVHITEQMTAEDTVNWTMRMWNASAYDSTDRLHGLWGVPMALKQVAWPIVDDIKSSISLVLQHYNHASLAFYDNIREGNFASVSDVWLENLSKSQYQVPFMDSSSVKVYRLNDQFSLLVNNDTIGIAVFSKTGLETNRYTSNGYASVFVVSSSIANEVIQCEFGETIFEQIYEKALAYAPQLTTATDSVHATTLNSIRMQSITLLASLKNLLFVFYEKPRINNFSSSIHAFEENTCIGTFQLPKLSYTAPPLKLWMDLHLLRGQNTIGFAVLLDGDTFITLLVINANNVSSKGWFEFIEWKKLFSKIEDLKKQYPKIEFTIAPYSTGVPPEALIHGEISKEQTQFSTSRPYEDYENNLITFQSTLKDILGKNGVVSAFNGCNSGFSASTVSYGANSEIANIDNSVAVDLVGSVNEEKTFSAPFDSDAIIPTTVNEPHQTDSILVNTAEQSHSCIKEPNFNVKDSIEYYKCQINTKVEEIERKDSIIKDMSMQLAIKDDEINQLRQQLERPIRPIQVMTYKAHCKGLKVPIRAEPRNSGIVTGYITDAQEVTVRREIVSGYQELDNRAGWLNMAVSNVKWVPVDLSSDLLYSRAATGDDPLASRVSAHNPLLDSSTFRPRTVSLLHRKNSVDSCNATGTEIVVQKPTHKSEQDEEVWL